MGFLSTFVSPADAIQFIEVAVSDETSDLTTGTNKTKFRMPYAGTITLITGSLSTVATGGTLLAVDINKNSSTILSTKMTFDASESTTTTATTPLVISDTVIAIDDEFEVDIDAVGSTDTGKGLKIIIVYTRT